MTLLYIIDEHPSISQTFVINEAAALSAAGVDVLCYALRRGPARRAAAEVEMLCHPPDRSNLARAAVASAPAVLLALWHSRRGSPRLREAARLWLAHAHANHIAKANRSRRIDHVHAHFLGRCADVANALAPRLGCRWTATAHGMDVYAPPDPGLMRGRLERVAAVACANRDLRERLARMAAPWAVRSEVIHCGVDTRALIPRDFDSLIGDPHVVTVGRLVATKGYWSVLGAAASLMERHPTLLWTIVGDGDLRAELESDPRCLRFAGRLRFLGSLTHQAALDVIAAATVFVLPCERAPSGASDGIPVAIMEAMALGVIVITAQVGGIAELVVAEETGYLVESGNASHLAETLERVLFATPADTLEAVRRAARRAVECDFDLHREAAKLVAFLEPYCPRTADELA